MVSLLEQTYAVAEVIIADGSCTDDTARVVEALSLEPTNMSVVQLSVQPPNAVRQRVAAIARAKGDLLLLLDDDIVVERDCVERMVEALEADPGVVGVFADLTNQDWPMPTRAWRVCLRLFFGVGAGEWQGAVVGPLMRFAFNPRPVVNTPMTWIGAGNSMVRRSAYDACGGFSDFFLHRCSINEDVDLGIKLSKVGTILFCPAARMAHFHAAGGRVSAETAAEDDLYNRYLVMNRTQGIPQTWAILQTALYYAVETISNLLGALRRRRLDENAARFKGRSKAMRRILFGV
jgi:GT2 family glycosyltransferase